MANVSCPNYRLLNNMTVSLADADFATILEHVPLFVETRVWNALQVLAVTLRVIFYWLDPIWSAGWTRLDPAFPEWWVSLFVVSREEALCAATQIPSVLYLYLLLWSLHVALGSVYAGMRWGVRKVRGTT